MSIFTGLFGSLSGWLMALIALIVSFFGTGCAADGFSPGPSSGQSSTLNLPGLGQSTFGGERDTILTIDGMTWAPGAAGPGIDSLMLNRSASGPLATRGTQQLLIEDQRDRHFDRVLDRIDRRIDMLIPLAQQYFPPPTQNTGSMPPTMVDVSMREQLRAVIEQILRQNGVPLPPTTAPNPHIIPGK